MKRYCIIVLALLLPMLGCEDDNKDRKFMSFDDKVMYDYLAEKAEFSEWCKLIECAGMKETFRLSTTPMTCFVVRNDVLLEYLKSKYDNFTGIENLDPAIAQTLLKYHTLPNVAMYLNAFRNGKLADSTASGDYLACLLSTGDGSIYLNREAKIIDYDIELVNGMLHVLDHVIDPVVNTFGDYLTANAGRYSLMKALVDACPDSTKAIFTQLDNDEVAGLKCRRTLFLVPDEFYKAAGITSVDELKEKAGITDEVTLDQYVRYHMLKREMYGKDIIERLELSAVPKDGTYPAVDEKGITLETMAPNKLLVANAGLLDVFFNEEAGAGLTFNGESYNIPVKNGVIHELNGILKIVEPESMITILDPTDYVNFGRISSYRSESIAKTQTLLKTEDYKPYLKWESTPSAKEDAIGYIVFTTGAYNFKGNGFHYGDCLMISVGPVGHVEFTTPPVPKGKYLVCPYYKTTKNAAGGKYKFSIDGHTVGQEISGYTPGGDGYFVTELGTVSFSETASHKVRLTAGSRQGEILLDLIILKPVN